MNTIVLGDIHGRGSWKKIIKKENDFDKVIFIGDYFDSRDDISGKQQVDNFKKICKFKRESDKEIILLVGNHDYHYFDINSHSEKYTGYQHDYAFIISNIIKENLDLLQLCYIQDDIIFSHAGISKRFLLNHELIVQDETFKDFNYSELVSKLNDLLKYKPNEFSFRNNCLFDEKGDDITQSPIWIRPASLLKGSINVKQIVGHTRYDEIVVINNKFYFIDALQNMQYLKIENDTIQIVSL